jgi:hypothetical protein
MFGGTRCTMGMEQMRHLALLHDHIECGKHQAAVVVAKAQAILSKSELRGTYYLCHWAAAVK